MFILAATWYRQSVIESSPMKLLKPLRSKHAMIPINSKSLQGRCPIILKKAHFVSVRHGRYVTLRLAEVAAPRHLFADILRHADRLRLKPMPA